MLSMKISLLSALGQIECSRTAFAVGDILAGNVLFIVSLLSSDLLSR